MTDVNDLFKTLGITCTQKSILYNTSTKRKSVYPVTDLSRTRNSQSEKTVTGFEATRPRDVIFLDIDAQSKHLQADALEPIVQYFQSDKCIFKPGVYIERSMNGGIHIIFKIAYNVLKKNLPSDVDCDDIVVEFKDAMLVFPTDGMTIIHKPESNNIPILGFVELTDMISEISNTLNHCSFTSTNVGSTFALQMTMSMNTMLKCCSRLATIDDDNDTNNTNTGTNMAIDTHITHSDTNPNSYSSSDQTMYMLLSPPQQATTPLRPNIESALAPRLGQFEDMYQNNNDAGCGYNRRRGSGSMIDDNEDGGHCGSKNKKRKTNNSNPISNKSNAVDYFATLVSNNRVYIAREIELDTKSEIKKLLGSTNEEVRVDARVSFIVRIMCDIAEWFTMHIRNTYYTDISIFLTMLSSTSVNGQCESDLFEKLSSFPRWRMWTISFINLMKSLERVRQGTGKHVFEKYDSFNLYRFITGQNPTGKQLSDAEARYEYDELYVETTRNGRSPDLTFLLYNFLIETFKNIKYSENLVYMLTSYITNLSDPSAINICKFELLSVRMAGLNFQNGYITESSGGSGRGELKKLMCININRCPWIKVTSPSFLKFLRKVYPNIEDLNKFIEKLNFAGHMCIDAGIRGWKCILPLKNGVIDFKTHFNMKRDITKVDCNRANDMTQPCIQAQQVCRDHKTIMFRNYDANDTVLEPLEYNFTPALYNQSSDHGILSLKNTYRYTEQFCWFIKGTFGVHENGEGVMYSWHYQRMIACMMILAGSILRTKPFQKCIVLNGTGSNGKSEFINQLVALFGDKCKSIDSGLYFASTDINQQAPDSEEAFLMYDTEAKTVNLERFKQHVADADATDNSREIFSKKMNKKCHTTFIMACNNPLKYSKKNDLNATKLDYDFAFHRRCFILNSYNIFDSTYKAKFNMTADETYRNISKGFLFYLLDLLNYFDIQNITSIYDTISSTTQEYKLLGAANNLVIRYMVDNYVVLNGIPESMFTSEEYSQLVEMVSTLSSKELMAEMTKKYGGLLSASPSSLKSTLTLFNYMCINSNDVMGCTDFKILGLIPIEDLGVLKDRIDFISNEPQKVFNKVYDRDDQMTDKEFVNLRIPEDCQICARKEVKSKFYKAIASILCDEAIELPTHMTVCDDYVNTTVDEVLDGLSKY